MMGDLLHLFVFILGILPVGKCLPWDGPSRTIDRNTRDSHLGWTLRQTEAPESPLKLELVKKDVITVGPDTCGWIDGNPSVPWVVFAATPNPSCIYNSDNKIVNGWYTCFDYGQTTTISCRSTCPVLYCPSATPFCMSVLFPSGYTAHGACNDVPSVTINVLLTYTGQIEPVDLPIYNGSNGLSTGTQYPPGYPSASSISTSTSPLSFPGGSASTLISSVSVSTTLISNPTSTHASTAAPTGAIVGGTIGGIALICATAIIVLLILRFKRKDPSSTGGAPPLAQVQSPHELDHSVHRPELEHSTVVPELDQSLSDLRSSHLTNPGRSWTYELDGKSKT